MYGNRLSMSVRSFLLAIPSFVFHMEGLFFLLVILPGHPSCFYLFLCLHVICIIYTCYFFGRCISLVTHCDERAIFHVVSAIVHLLSSPLLRISHRRLNRANKFFSLVLVSVCNMIACSFIPLRFC